jgi:hypothetical protein
LRKKLTGQGRSENSECKSDFHTSSFGVLDFAFHYNRSMFGLTIGAAVAVGAGASIYQSMAPTGQWFGRNFSGGNAGSK